MRYVQSEHLFLIGHTYCTRYTVDACVVADRSGWRALSLGASEVKCGGDWGVGLDCEYQK
jgi:hypothetical protein